MERRIELTNRYTGCMGNYELMLRGIMDLPNRPAIINLQSVLLLPNLSIPGTFLTSGLRLPHILNRRPSPSWPRFHVYTLIALELTNSIFALMFRQLALGGDMVIYLPPHGH